MFSLPNLHIYSNDFGTFFLLLYDRKGHSMVKQIIFFGYRNSPTSTYKYVGDRYLPLRIILALKAKIALFADSTS